MGRGRKSPGSRQSGTASQRRERQGWGRRGKRVRAGQREKRRERASQDEGSRGQEKERRSIRVDMASSVLAVIARLVPGAAKVAGPRFHREIERRLLDLSVTRFCVVAPRGHAKSTLVAVGFVLWHIFLEPTYRSLCRKVGRGFGRDNEVPDLWPRDEEGRMAPRFVVLISKTQGEAKKRLATIKSVLGDDATGKYSKAFRWVFGNWGYETAAVWTADKIKLRDGSMIVAVGTGQPVRGMNEDNQRPTLVVGDDMEDEENTKTAERMQANARWLAAAILPALDPKVGRLVVIGTPQNAQCMVVGLHKSYQVLDEGDSLWFQNDAASETSRWSVSRADWSTWAVDEDGNLVVPDDYGEGAGRHGTVEEEGEAGDGQPKEVWLRFRGVLWPLWIGKRKLRVERTTCEETPTVGLGVYYREWECKVVGDGEQVFVPSYFEQHWRGSLKFDLIGQPYIEVTHLRGGGLVGDDGRAKPLRLPCVVTTGVDPAFSTSARADRTAIANIATTYSEVEAGGRGLEHWELPGFYKKVKPSALRQAIAANHERMKPERGMIEVVAAQIMLYHDLAKDYGIRYVKDNPRTKKKGEGSRIERIQTPMEAKRFWHHRNDRGRASTPLEAELLLYPRGKDDYADATEKAYRLYRRPPVVDHANPDNDLVLSERDSRYERFLQEGSAMASGTVFFDPMLA